MSFKVGRFLTTALIVSLLTQMQFATIGYAASRRQDCLQLYERW